ncbi:hypothetical protein FGO68_gene4845 [Halteria grandinella]|uniref:Uncharacterized protein n=1 Tax=Halteria grandinella TaxID=5974 RepID=A0A8J8NH25_HALGN|nr:hypothetical protein FGO68_gene4845 [Halteria grandinella]
MEFINQSIGHCDIVIQWQRYSLRSYSSSCFSLSAYFFSQIEMQSFNALQSKPTTNRIAPPIASFLFCLLASSAQSTPLLKEYGSSNSLSVNSRKAPFARTQKRSTGIVMHLKFNIYYNISQIQTYIIH